MVDTERIISAYLRDHPLLAQWADRIVPRTPSSTASAWLRVQLIDGRQAPRSRALHLINTLVQIDCYAGEGAGGQGDANGMAVAVVEALNAMPGASTPGAFVSSARSSWRRLPDTTFTPARERYIVETQLVLHPA
jgi:hypothetical protein